MSSAGLCSCFDVVWLPALPGMCAVSPDLGHLSTGSHFVFLFDVLGWEIRAQSHCPL